MAKSKTTKTLVGEAAESAGVDRLTQMLSGLTSTVTDDKCRQRSHELRLALIDSATKVVTTLTDPNCVATAMGYLNHHYSSIDPVSPEAVAPAA